MTQLCSAEMSPHVKIMSLLHSALTSAQADAVPSHTVTCCLKGLTTNFMPGFRNSDNTFEVCKKKFKKSQPKQQNQPM